MINKPSKRLDQLLSSLSVIEREEAKNLVFLDNKYFCNIDSITPLKISSSKNNVIADGLLLAFIELSKDRDFYFMSKLAARDLENFLRDTNTEPAFGDLEFKHKGWNNFLTLVKREILKGLIQKGLRGTNLIRSASLKENIEQVKVIYRALSRNLGKGFNELYYPYQVLDGEWIFAFQSEGLELNKNFDFLELLKFIMVEELSPSFSDLKLVAFEKEKV